MAHFTPKPTHQHISNIQKSWWIWPWFNFTSILWVACAKKLPNQCVIKHIRAVQNNVIQKHFLHFLKCFSNWPPNVAGIKTVNSFFWFVTKIYFCLFCLLSHAIQSILSKLTTFFRSKKWIRNNILRNCIALCRFPLC